MKYPLPLTLRVRTLSAAACVTALLIAATFSSVLPTSFARAPAKTRTNNLQEPKVAITTGTYRQTNLVSHSPGVALVEDRELLQAEGIAVSSNSPFWVVDHETGSARLYKGDVSGSPLVINAALPSVSIPNVPTLNPAPSRPTGVVANETSDFVITVPGFSPAPAQFIFATLNGAISAWQPLQGSQPAVVVKFMSGHSYTGLAIGSNASGNLLFVADDTNRKIDVFDKDFNLTSVPGNFTDPTIPANFTPFNIRNLGGALYVTYAQSLPGSNPDLGMVRKFDMNGVRDPAFAINNGPLRNPWALAIAPANFGTFSNRLLVGNTYSLGLHEASINAFDPATGALIGNMVDEGGAPLELGFWGFTFGNGANGGDQNTLYFSALPAGLGSLRAVSPSPATLIKLSATEYFTSEGVGHLDVTVTRTGDLSGTATVNYATRNTNATQISNFEIALGRLTFNPGEASKTFRVLIVDNNEIGGGTLKNFQVVLSNATGAALVSPTIAYVYIMDDEFDTPRLPPNIVDDTQFFVRQHYFDFLNREPDAAGLNFWTNQILSCGTDQQCIELKRINVSAAFFLSIEFQKTGMLAYLTERATTGALPRFGPFMRDVQALQKDYVFGAPGASAQLESNIKAFFDEFITRPEFVAAYGSLSNENYVGSLLANGGISTSTGRLMITRLDGAQVVPPNGTSATGVAISRISFTNLDTVDFSLTLKNLGSPQTAAHIHGPAVAGSNAPALVTLPNGDFRDFTVTFTAQQGADMRGGRLYLDVHTQNNPDGEIRGQIGPLRFQRDVLVNGLNAGLINRAEALRLIVEDGDFRHDQFNRAFVLMEYFGYLRRNPDDPPDNNLDGYNFWLNKLNQFNGNFVNADMVKAFIKSTEYRRRFGPP